MPVHAKNAAAILWSVCAATVCVAWFGIVAPSESNIARLRRAGALYEQKTMRNHHAIREAALDMKFVGQLRQRLQQQHRDAGALFRTLLDIDRNARHHHVRVAGVEPDAPSGAATQTALTLHLDGRFGDLVTTIGEIAEQSEILRVRGARFVAASDARGQVNATVATTIDLPADARGRR